MRKFILKQNLKPPGKNYGGWRIKKTQSGLKHKVSKLFASFITPFKTRNKFTIHPFRSLHSRHLLPLSLTDYFARFSLELIVLGIAIFSVFANTAMSRSSANLSGNKDRSLIFSFLRTNPSLNTPLVAQNETTTISGLADQWISQAHASPFSSVVLASANSAEKHNTTAASTIQDNVIVKTNPADTSNLRHGKTTYEVQSGDNLVSIASSFGISAATIIVENKIDANAGIKPGQDLSILPVDGISYTLKSGDTLEAIAAKYKVNLDDLLEINDLELATDVQAGDTIIIPTQVNLPTTTAPKKFITDNSNKVKLTQAAAPGNLSAGNLSFIWPTTTHNVTQGFSSRHSGIDISDSKMEPIYAAESGFVEIAGFQTNGYGNTIVINHGSGFKTRYGHASELYVTAGAYVTKGQLIAKQGHTGHVRGATGIHLHFEIMKNNVRVNPLSYVKP